MLTEITPTNRRKILTGLASCTALAVAGSAIGTPARLFADILSNPNLSNQATQEIFKRIVEKAQRENWRVLPIGECIIAIALEFLGTPYVGGTCEGTAVDGYRETCKVDLKGLDCVTFFETSLCIARVLARSATPTFDDVLSEVVFTRYRGGKLTDYTSRLHYTSEWFQDNEQKNVVKNITREDKNLRGMPLVQTVNFMSSNPTLYPALKAAPALVPRLQQTETSINTLSKFFIPTAEIRAAQDAMRSGDIVGIVTSKEGLDYSHTGLVFRDKADKQGAVRFLHASQKQKKVMLDGELAQYLADSKTARGITLVRPLEVA